MHWPRVVEGASITLLALFRRGELQSLAIKVFCQLRTTEFENPVQLVYKRLNEDSSAKEGERTFSPACFWTLMSSSLLLDRGM